MLRRTIAIAVTTVMLTALVATPAFGWGNGGDGIVSKLPGDGYGTHDWILEHAIRTAAASGKDVSWINVQVALEATDDPDYRETKTSKLLHTFIEKGTAQGAPQAAADEYHQLMTAYKSGNYKDASRLLGVMSHYYADACSPYHTYSLGVSSENPRHELYESDVSDMTRKYSASTGWLSRWSRKDVTDVRAKTVSAALYARSKYKTLDASYKKNGNAIKKGTASYTITGQVLNRAVNDLADIIGVIPQGRGLALPPAVMKQRMMKKTYYFPRRGTSSSDIIRSEVYCYDRNGKPMRGVAVKFTWPMAKGPKTAVAYTNADGMAYNWQAPGTGITLMRKRTLSARSVASGQVATSTTWYMPTPVLASGSTGVKTSVSNNRPKRGTRVKAKTRFRDKKGNPVVGLPVTFKWYFKSGTVTVKTVTDSKGYARTSRNIGKAAKGYRVYVKGSAYSGRYARYSRASFIPQ